MITTFLTKADINSPLIVSKPEIELLLCCARSKVDDQTQIKIKHLVEQEIDWQYLVAIADKHRLIPLLFHNLNKLCREAIPQNIFSYLDEYFKVHARQSLLVTNELLQIIDLFKAHNIEAIPFKGPTLAVSGYKNLALRQFCDLDILINKKDIIRSVELLTTVGYSLPKRISEAEQKSYIQDGKFLESDTYQKGYEVIHKKKNIVIDLQWSLTEKRKSKYFPIDFQDLKTNAMQINIGGREVFQFSSEDMLLFLCFHGSKHCWQSFRWICDVAEFILAHRDLDWQKLEVKAKQLNCETILWLSLFLIYDLLEVPLPNDILLRMKTKHRAYLLSNKVYKLIFTRNFTQWEDYIFLFRITDSLQGKYQFINSLLFTPTAKEWEFLKLPKYLSFLYFFIRPYRLLIEFFNKQYNSSKKVC